MASAGIVPNMKANPGAGFPGVGTNTPGSNQYYSNFPAMLTPQNSNPDNSFAPARGGPAMQQPQQQFLGPPTPSIGGGGFPGAGGGGYPGYGGGVPYGGGTYGPYGGYGVPSQGGYTGGNQVLSPTQPFDPQAYVQSAGGSRIVSPQNPALTGVWGEYLLSQLGQGVMPFNLPTALPGGGFTQPGQLSAPLNPIGQDLMRFFQGGQSQSPGLNQLGNIASSGISALPEWQQMIQAQQQNIQQQQANLQEQFARTGNLAGSPFGTAESNFLQGVTSQQNALLGQLQQQNILQGQIPVAESLFGGQQQFAGGLQQLNQQAIQNMFQEFLRTSPQYNPLNQYIGQLATTYPPSNLQGGSGGGFFGGLLSGLGSLASGTGNLLTGIGNL